MLVQMGRRAASEDVVDLLTECHHRIRGFLAMARSLAEAPRCTAAEVAATAAQIRRYFSEGLPLHVEDEDIDIAPHIAEDTAARVHAEHGSHEREVADLVGVCRELERHPEHLAMRAAGMSSTVRDLTARLEAHLVYEESVVFPQIRALDRTRQRAIRDAMRARRERHLDSAG